MGNIDKESAIRTVKTVLEAAGLTLSDLLTEPQTWHLDEDAAESLSQFIGDSEPAPITLSVGAVAHDDGTEKYGLRCWNSEYPEEGCILLVESERPVSSTNQPHSIIGAASEHGSGDSVDPLDRFPPPIPGYERSWVACNTCDNIAYYDYIPYGLGNPILTLPCGHQGGQSFNQATRKVTEAEAREFYSKQG